MPPLRQALRKLGGKVKPRPKSGRRLINSGDFTYLGYRQMIFGDGDANP